MKILYAAYEAAPFFQTGGLGDVARSLPSALARLDIKTTLILPWYHVLKLPEKPKKIGSFDIEFNKQKESVRIFASYVTKHINLYLVSHPFLFEAIERKRKAEKFIFFSKAITKMLSLRSQKEFASFDVVHLNDWHTAMVAFFISRSVNRLLYPPTILTIHNLLYQGNIEREKLVDLLELTRNEKDELSSILGVGMTHTDYITTVSPTYAYEIVHTKLGFNLREILACRKRHVLGILNGIDYKLWDPEKDEMIVAKFNKSNFEAGKRDNKLALQKELKLPISETLPLVSFIGRLEPNQKGIDLIIAMLKDLLAENSFQFILLGTGNKFWAERISLLVAKYPRRIVFANKFDQVLSHKIYASSDIILIPSRFEPCGLIQMIAMRYGTLPLVRHTGGLADTVVDRKNGFVFESYSSAALTRTLRLALKTFRENPEKIHKMRQIALREDFSWDKSAKEYKRLYKRIIREHKGKGFF